MTLTLKTLPTVKGFRSIEFGLDGRSQAFTSPLSGTSQIAIVAPPRWRGVYETPPLDASNARTWRAFLASLKGRGNVFYGHDPSFEGYAGLDDLTADASATLFDSDAITFDSSAVTFDEWAGPVSAGSPTVLTGGQVGSILKTTGWTPALRLNAGEYIAYDATDSDGNVTRALHMLETAITVGETGRANLTVIPDVRIPPDAGAVIQTTRPGCTMRLLTDDGGRWAVDTNRHHRIRFEAVQVLVGAPAV